VLPSVEPLDVIHPMQGAAVRYTEVLPQSRDRRPHSRFVFIGDDNGREREEIGRPLARSSISGLIYVSTQQRPRLKGDHPDKASGCPRHADVSCLACWCSDGQRDRDGHRLSQATTPEDSDRRDRHGPVVLGVISLRNALQAAIAAMTRAYARRVPVAFSQVIQWLWMVGDTGIEPVTSSVSGKRATAAPIAQVIRGGYRI
jgi:hypothetical protein